MKLPPDELVAAMSPRTKMILVNTPHNPTGKVFTTEELGEIAALCCRWDVYAVTDEIYEHIYYEGQHIPMATLPGMRDRTILLGGFSKNYAMTGWRIGYACANPDLLGAMRKVHQYTIMSAPTTAQVAAGFVVSPEAMAQRLHRARVKVRDAGIPFRIPADADLPDRLTAVVAVVRLVLNEGYVAADAEELQRPDLAHEAAPARQYDR